MIAEINAIFGDSGTLPLVIDTGDISRTLVTCTRTVGITPPPEGRND